MKTEVCLILIFFAISIGYSKNTPINGEIKVNPYLKYKNNQKKKISIKDLIKIVSSSNDNINYRTIIFSEQ